MECDGSFSVSLTALQCLGMCQALLLGLSGSVWKYYSDQWTQALPCGCTPCSPLKAWTEQKAEKGRIPHITWLLEVKYWSSALRLSFILLALLVLIGFQTWTELYMDFPGFSLADSNLGIFLACITTWASPHNIISLCVCIYVCR